MRYLYFLALLYAGMNLHAQCVLQAPFTVIASPGYNSWHLNVNNSKLRYSEKLTNCENLVYVLNREIGDETLWLNNRILPWQSRFEAELDITANEGSNNPHYEYDGITPIRPVSIGRFYSKQNPLTISAVNPVTNSGFNVDFRSELPLNYNPPYAPLTIQVNHLQEDVWICCKEFSEYKRPLKEESPDSKETLTLYPNPFADSFLAEILVSESGVYQVIVIDALGKVVSKENIELEEGIMTFKTFSNQLPSGLYFVQLISANGHVISNQKIAKR